jgi:tetratricopeptide (TPR) repeat protein
MKKTIYYSNDLLKYFIGKTSYLIIPLILLVSYSCSTSKRSMNLPGVNSEERKIVINKICNLILEEYVFPEVAEKCAELLKEKLSKGKYDNLFHPGDFANEIVSDLQSISNDKHFRLSVLFGMEDKKRKDNNSQADLQRKIEYNHFLQRGNFGFIKVQWKSGNIGYLDLRAFISVDIAAEKAISVMKFLSNMDAIIIDLRKQVKGGAPEMVALLCSYFFKKPTLLGTTYIRKTNKTYENWTLGKVDGNRMHDVPLYILTSNHVFSAGESFTYSLQALNRVKVIGEITKGGAHLTKPVKLNERFIFYVPFGRAINPITKTNWEGVGIKPDIIVDADDAFDVALKMAQKAAKKHRKLREERDKKLAKVLLKKFMHSVQQFVKGEKEKSFSSLYKILLEGLQSGILTEEMINQKGYELMNKKLVDLAIEMFKFNVEMFPKSYIVFESLGEAYMIKGEYKPAIENYNKSLEINPHNKDVIKNFKKVLALALEKNKENKK